MRRNVRVTPPAQTGNRHDVQAVRHLLAERRFALLLCVATLLLRLLVPTGYMIDREHGHVAITLCSGTIAAETAVPMPGMRGAMPDHGKTKDHGKAEMPCAFSGLSAAMTGGVDPIQLEALVAFIMAVGLAVQLLPALCRPAYLRPPLRGPPAYL
jgi:hypothetical protein